MTDTTRDAFEKWFTTGDADVRLTRIGDTYTLMSAHTSWEAWQAATPQGKRQPLTDGQIEALINWIGDPSNLHYSRIYHVRAIEAAHGITATPQGKI